MNNSWTEFLKSLFESLIFFDICSVKHFILIFMILKFLPVYCVCAKPVSNFSLEMKWAQKAWLQIINNFLNLKNFFTQKLLLDIFFKVVQFLVSNRFSVSSFFVNPFTLYIYIQITSTRNRFKSMWYRLTIKCGKINSCFIKQWGFTILMELIKFRIKFVLHREKRLTASLFRITLVPISFWLPIWVFFRRGGLGW